MEHITGAQVLGLLQHFESPLTTKCPASSFGTFLKHLFGSDKDESISIESYEVYNVLMSYIYYIAK